jgi:thiamine-monophosphate kinase
LAGLHEDELIARFFAPLADEHWGFGLKDDAAWLRGDFGAGLVATTDALVAGVHFFAEDDPADVAWKALAVNVSDLAAKGAEPAAYLLTLGLTSAPEAEWAERFASGLQDAQTRFGMALAGGDTVRTAGAWWLSITALGRPGERGMIRRGGAKPGDALYVSGALGDAALGLRLRQKAVSGDGLAHAERELLLRRYLRPQPRLALIPALRACASAAMDLSDGLALDAARLCAASGVSARIDAARLPLSETAARLAARHPSCREAALTGGDDYEILAAIPPRLTAHFQRLAADAGLPATQIGEIIAGAAPPVFHERGKPLVLLSEGFQHF